VEIGFLNITLSVDHDYLLAPKG